MLWIRMRWKPYDNHIICKTTNIMTSESELYTGPVDPSVRGETVTSGSDQGTALFVGCGYISDVQIPLIPLQEILALTI